MPIPESEKPIVKGVIQKEKVIVDGVEVDGTWNAFMVETTQTGYDPSIWDEVANTLEGVTISACWQCGTCTSGCTMREYDPDFGPRKFIDLARKGDKQALIQLQDSLWRCVSCQKCTHRCPKGVMVEEVVHSIHNYFLKHNLVKKDPGTIFDELFLETVMRNGGRISELTLGMAASKAGMVTLGIKDLISIGAAMLKGKLVGDVLKPNRVKNWDKIKEVLEEAMKEEVVPE
ncbi:4Fe-4S dicluster domain-containing protein [Sulfolobus acidocaldarius]|uniref:4Fe-4S binding domain protein n=4 Tax=Sulfolobus acidocaldarius TaxID=2285 RepID=Q4JBT7_SULAC|nr:4Fe-4S dicluster domain-containing protein [Sulfolobus acidocaldarius]AAY79742.1 4Fe-4S binding domain protein [Sulfolobus acidocaldarius DSM 639]AGE70301.1 heterodisulfide reductase subunit C [Sulfolobus acidocaldarius N8]AGE72576.1 heterodisulfide reductase subunit C [Sulfolobus acidocaldarius Ron12/I]ALU29298.1 heterodisulfide reductase subunit C [Sulfolobus acidocaldarius]ALU32027.1 heterodisulfide reductase subunit C [Sulfolobus acidocaldarius]